MKKPIIVVLAVVVALAIAGGAYAFINRDSKDNSRSSQSSQSEEQAEEASTSTQTEETLSSLTSGGQARQCDIDYKGEKGEGSGKVYTDGQGRGRMTIDVKAADGKQSQINTLVTKENAYLWFASGGQSFGFSFSVDAFKDTSSNSPIASTGGVGPNEKFTTECTGWSVDEGLLTPPSDVNFTAFSLPS